MKSLVFINHIYCVLASNSFDEIKESTFLSSEFANIEHKIVSSGSQTWEGLYIRGEKTYIELFYPQGEKQFSTKGNTGIGLGTDKLGDIDIVYKKLYPAIPYINKAKFTREVDLKVMDWFTYVTQKDSFIAPHQSLWIMEYDESYTGSKDVTRKTYNAPYYDSHKLFKNITGLTVAIEPMSQENYINILSHIGYSCKKTATNEFSCKNHDLDIDIIPETKQNIGIQKIILGLNRVVEYQKHKIGDTTLILEGTKGIWDLNG